jgi:hypothetical protein
LLGGGPRGHLADASKGAASEPCGPVAVSNIGLWNSTSATVCPQAKVSVFEPRQAVLASVAPDM